MKSKRQKFKQWANMRPATVRCIIRTIKPWHIYRIKDTGQIGTIYSYCENGTITVRTSDLTGLVPFKVFGLKPSDLERIK